MSGIVKNGLRLAGTAKYVTNNTAIFNSQYSRSISHISNQLNNKNSIALVQSYNLCSCGCEKFQHTQAGEELAKKIISNPVKQTSSKKSDEAENSPKDKSWFSNYKFSTRFYKFGVRVDCDIPFFKGWCNLQLATQTIDGQPTYKDGIPIHPDIINSNDNIDIKAWLSQFKFNTTISEDAVQFDWQTPRYNYQLRIYDDQSTHKDDTPTN
ncbi:hypothetical protein HCN44_007556 [Aphidius gifuensis]|uniref:Uncharacterized protein n=1 Tax=Aphidius gifuensis TaxID=684658 RepID=A0A834XJS9_APHGI|nr:hypothetical protein HCN44_007556 [Aphidius gifuensis]